MKTRALYPPVNGTEPCRTGDPERYFPHGGPQVDAEALCTGCHVLAQCLAYALDATDNAGYPLGGVWGGTRATERKRMNKGRRRPPQEISHGTEGGYKAHRRRGEDACGSCLEANRTAQQQRRAGGLAA
jgi:hypothetical protein